MFSYSWTHGFTIPPLEAVLDAVEAYCTTLADARYELGKRERFCLEFRRGAWRGKWLDPDVQVPRFFGIDRFNITTWPTILRVTALPSPTAFDIRLRREVAMPNGLPLKPAHRAVGGAAFDRETEGLIEYLTSFLHLSAKPDVRQETQTSNAP